MRSKPPHVSYYRDRHGKVRWRFRKRGLKEAQTAALYGSDDWWVWYENALNQGAVQVGAGRMAPGSLNAVIALYLASPDWTMLGSETKRTRKPIITRLQAKFGHKAVAKLDAEGVKVTVEALSDKPSGRRNTLKVIRGIVKFAVDRGKMASDPTIGVRFKVPKTDGHRTWTEHEISQFEAKWKLGTRERLAFDLLLYTAQRSGDVRQMGRQHVRDGLVSVRQGKTAAFLEIPVHERLRASIAAFDSGHLTFVVTQHGDPYSAAGFGNWFNRACRDAGLTNATAHGLRKAAARRLAEAGASAHEIMAITGHKTLAEVDRYTRAAEQRTLARAAMQRVGRTDQEQNLSNHPDPVRQSDA